MPSFQKGEDMVLIPEGTAVTLTEVLPFSRISAARRTNGKPQMIAYAIIPTRSKQISGS